MLISLYINSITELHSIKAHSWLRSVMARTHGQKGTQICDPLASKGS